METVPLNSKEQATSELVNRGITLMTIKYGDENSTGEHSLRYHNGFHAREVLDAIANIGKLAFKNGRITENDLLLLQVTAVFHDVEQFKGAGVNEDESAIIAADEMEKTRVFTKEDVERVGRGIKATKVQVKNGVMVQEATDEYFTKIICDADWFKFGADFEIYWKRSLDYLKEVKKADRLTKEEISEFAVDQIALLERHKFFTEEAKIVFPNKEANIARTIEFL